MSRYEVVFVIIKEYEESTILNPSDRHIIRFNIV